MAGARETKALAGLKKSGSQYQLAVLSEPQMVIAALMLDDDFLGAAEQFGAGYPGWRRGLRCLVRCGGIASRLMLTHIVMITILNNVVKRDRLVLLR